MIMRMHKNSQPKTHTPTFAAPAQPFLFLDQTIKKGTTKTHRHRVMVFIVPCKLAYTTVVQLWCKNMQKTLLPWLLCIWHDRV